MPDFRALCAELLQELEHASAWDYQQALKDQARAALEAQPEPQGPSDEEIDDWHHRCADLTRVGEADHYWAFDLQHDEVAGVVRAALARWGRSAIEPVPGVEGEP